MAKRKQQKQPKAKFPAEVYVKCGTSFGGTYHELIPHNDLIDGETVGVYQFVGVKKVKQHTELV